MERRAAVLAPIPRPSDAKEALAPRLDTLAGKRIGLINNGWRCMHIASEEIQRVLLSQYRASAIVEMNTTAIRPLNPDQLSALAETVDGVVCGIGN